MDPVWRVEMLGTFQALRPEQTVSRFRTRRVATLLAYLALDQNRLHSRDELGELLWPDSDLQVSRRNLRQALSSLRHALEPPPMPSGSVLQVEQSRLRLNPETLDTDLAEFERLIQRAKTASDLPSELDSLKQAVALYKGDLLPGFEEFWVLNERLRMEDLYTSALIQLVDICEELEQPQESIHFLRLALGKEPLNESWHTSLMRQYLKVGRPQSALKQYGELARLLESELNCEPDEEARKLYAKARRQAGRGASPPSDAESSSPPESDPAQERPRETVRLPVQLTRLFGRQAEIETLVDRFSVKGDRLVTILGSAGTGKTRLSVEVAKELAKGGWHTWFVPLADMDDATLLLDRILDILKPRAHDRSNVVDQIRDAIDHDRSLLILDNFEHIVEDAAAIVGTLLQSVPNASCLVTSRQSLKLDGEIEFPLEPLPVPMPSSQTHYDTTSQLALLAEVPSIQMFVDRCQAVRPDVQLTLNNARHFADICSKLEGVPLAIEIAAGLSNSFAPAQMVKHLDNRLAALASRRRDIPARHRSLRVAIEYSFAFLSPSLQRLFAALSVFRGGFTVEAAMKVCHQWETGDPCSGEACLGAVLDLQERSLLRAEQGAQEDGELRFRLMEIFREYGEERLTDAERQELRDRHANYYLESSTPENAIGSAEERSRQQARVEADYDNYIAALEHLFQTREMERCIRLIGALSILWDVRGTKAIEQNYIRQIASLPETESASPESRIHLLRMLGTTYLRTSDFKSAYKACKDALKVAQSVRREELIASCYYGMALCAGYMGQAEHCIELCGKVLDHAPASNGVLLERTYVSIGSAHWARDELANAEAAFIQAKEVSEAFRNGEADALIFAHLAGVYLERGKFDEAMMAAGEGIRISRRLRNDISLSASLAQVARYHRMKGNMPAAIATSHEALLLGRDVAISALALEIIRGHALILCQFDQHAVAATLVAASQGMEVAEKIADSREKELALGEIRAMLSPEEFERAWARGLAMDTDEAFRLALRYK